MEGSESSVDTKANGGTKKSPSEPRNAQYRRNSMCIAGDVPQMRGIKVRRPIAKIGIADERQKTRPWNGRVVEAIAEENTGIPIQ